MSSLTLLTLATATLLPVQEPAHREAHASLHPAGALLYLEIPDLLGVQEAYEEAGLVRMLRASEVQATLGELIGGGAPIDAFALLRSQVQAQGGPFGRRLFELADESLAGVSMSVAIGRPVETAISSLERVLAAATHMDQLGELLDVHAEQHGGEYPATLAGLSETLDYEARDPWGNEYAYEVHDNGRYQLSCLGSDGARGGDREASDLDSRYSAKTKVGPILGEPRIQVTLELSTPAEALELAGLVGDLPVVSPAQEQPPVPAGAPYTRRLFEVSAQPVSILTHGRFLTVAVGGAEGHPADPEGLIERITGGLPGYGPALEEALTRLPAARGRTVWHLDSTCGDLVRQVLELNMAPSGGASTTLAVSAGELFLGSAGPAILRGGTFRQTLQGGTFIAETFVPEAPGEGSPVFGHAPLGERAKSYIHPDAAIGWVSSLDTDRATELVMSAIEESSFGEDIESLQAEFEIDLRADLFAPLGSMVSFSMPNLRSLMSAPPMFGMVELTDPDRMQGVLQKLMGIVSEASEGEVQVSMLEYRGVSIFTAQIKSELDSGLPIDPTKLFQPTFAVLPDRLLVTISPIQAKKEVRRLMKGKDEVNAIVSAIEVPAPATSLMFADWAAFLTKLYTSGKALAPMLAAGGELPFDPEALPEAETFLAFFGPIISWQTRVEGGTRGETHSSLGPEVLGLGLGMAATVWVVPARAVALPDDGEQEWGIDEKGYEAEGHEHEAVGEDPTDQGTARADLQAISSALSRFATHNGGRHPDELDWLVMPDANGHRFLDAETVPLDPWGSAYRYRAGAEGGVVLYSSGPNGRDEGGQGDDVVN